MSCAPVSHLKVYFPTPCFAPHVNSPTYQIKWQLRHGRLQYCYTEVINLVVVSKSAVGLSKTWRNKALIASAIRAPASHLKVYFPTPCLAPHVNSPTYLLPSAHVCTPTPWLCPLAHCPAYTSPV